MRKKPRTGGAFLCVRGLFAAVFAFLQGKPPAKSGKFGNQLIGKDRFAVNRSGVFRINLISEVADVVVYMNGDIFAVGKKRRTHFDVGREGLIVIGAVYNQRRRFGVFKHQFGSVNINFRLCQHVLVADRAQCSEDLGDAIKQTRKVALLHQVFRSSEA